MGNVYQKEAIYCKINKISLSLEKILYLALISHIPFNFQTHQMDNLLTHDESNKARGAVWC